jgi:hypothetical protein
MLIAGVIRLARKLSGRLDSSLAALTTVVKDRVVERGLDEPAWLCSSLPVSAS